MEELEPFLMQEAAFPVLADPERLLGAIAQGATLHELLGFSAGAMRSFYRTAAHLIEEARYKDARDAFTFLSTLAPQISEFWDGLGIACFYLQEYDGAVEAFTQEAELEPESINGFFMLARTLAEVARFDEANAILDRAIAYAGEHKTEPWAGELIESAEETKVLVRRHAGRAA